MRVCLLAWMLDVEKHAGVGRVGEEILKGLTARGYDVVTVTLNNSSHMAYIKYLLWDLPRQIPPADVYICQSPMESIFAPKNKTICVVHDIIPLNHSHLAGARMNGNPIKTFLGSRFYWLGAKSASRCKRIVCNSSQTRDELKQYFKVSDERLRVIDLGVRPDLDYKPKQDNIFRIGYLGQLDRRKRVNLLIDAFKQSNINGELVIAGSGPDRSKLEALAGNDKRIQFLGFVPDDKLCEFYNSLDLFAFPSAAEGWGIPIVEAMACRKDVLITGDAFIPNELRSRCHYMGSNVFELFKEYPNLPSKVKHEEDNYRFAHSLTWDNFVSGLEKVIQEVAHD